VGKDADEKERSKAVRRAGLKLSGSDRRQEREKTQAKAATPRLFPSSLSPPATPSTPFLDFLPKTMFLLISLHPTVLE
jgi:hypothetical protein